ncbi:PucR family transcriptional regulator ligand-binding domain-containing protein [Streptomyces sp. GMY02]|uniref:PucR family transcriptional regulator ligand-binding domain-containing protein n=1 Tax=Streptomyces sp. GMY02 TaxID=1333528 RepID=UPI001C2C32BE|nr:PucR family transcriptional regulator ligand-binding domain-containing protein [Streptomyces sp. GMY02]QXE38952.1 PucR family transcriptional regulator ligand-binding domain-containing protein [Streptomyces sp. GMY02]
MRLRALLDTDALGLRLLGGEDELDRSVRGVMTTDLRDPSRYLSGGELVLTGLAWRRRAEESEPFVRILVAAGVAALAAGEAELGEVPDDLIVACARHRLPLFAVSEAVAFATITEYVVRQVSGERAGDLAAVVDRHRRLMTAGPAGGGPDAVLDLLGSDLDLRAWVLSPTGRQIAGAGKPLPAARATALAGEHLAATRAGRRSPYRTSVDGTAYSLFPVREPGRGPSALASPDVRETVLSDWVLAVEADAGDWPTARLDLLRGVTQLIAVERDRRDAARAVRRRLAQDVVELVQAAAAPAEIAARLRVAAPVLLPGLTTAPHWQVVVATVDWGRDGGSGQGGHSGHSGHSGTGTGTEVSGGPVAQALLEEILAGPVTPGAGATGAAAGAAGATVTDSPDRIAVARTGDEAVALVPLPAMPAVLLGLADPSEADPDPDPEPGLHADALLAAVREPLSAGLADDGRLTLGVSAVVHSAEGLRGALEEARHARRVAAARVGRVCAAGHHELASHVLLLPFVPDDVRRAFTARLLDPLRAYDRRHRAELIPTLEAFLDCDGSWTRCAARLHLHVNTLRYRVGRIEQLTGRDLSRLEDKLDFFLALRMS